MIRTKSIFSKVNEIPDTWIFEYYLSIPKLTGQDVNIKSIWNPKDKNPSFFVYYNNTKGKYLFKDFSVDKGGDGVDLVKIHFNLPNRNAAAEKIVKDYNDFTLDSGEYKVTEFKVKSRYKVKEYQVRNWTKVDEKYWMQFKINSKILEHFNVSPISHYTLYQPDTNNEMKVVASKIYGYFKRDGELYKIYQPGNERYKFFNVGKHIQGMDQLTFEKDYLVICSSMKDLLAFHKLGFTNAEGIAPDSENTLIPERIIVGLKERYKSICTLFDNDEAGIRAMLKYKDRYQLNGVHLKLEKDLADSVQAHGINNTRIHLYPILTKALTGTIKLLP